MLSNIMSTAPDTPDVAASGATTQWANGPTAPPFLNRNDDLASMNIGTLLEKEKTV